MLPILLLLVLFFTKPVFAEPLIKITNFSSNSSPEWVEVQNIGTSNIDLTGWKIRDGNATLTDDLTLSGCISPDSYLTFSHSSGWLNDSSDTITIYDSQNAVIDTLVYSVGKTEPVFRNTSTCVLPTSTPSPTLTPSATATPTSPTATPTIPTNTPTRTPTPTVKPSLSPTPTLEPPLTPINDPLPSYIDNSPTTVPTSTPISYPNPTKVKTASLPVLPLIFMAIGGGLLLLPVIISKIRK